jgi:hypothetical protein
LEKILRHPAQPRRTQAPENLHLIAESLKRRSLTVLFSDLWIRPQKLDRLIDALKHLRSKSSELIVFHVLSKSGEVNFDFPDRPVRFVDSETGKQLNLFPSEIKNAYLKKQKAYNERLREAFFKYRIDYQPVFTETPYSEIMSAYLQKRLRLK